MLRVCLAQLHVCVFGLVFLSQSAIPLSSVCVQCDQASLPCIYSIAALAECSAIGIKGKKRGEELPCFKKEINK